ncbi:MAG: glycosyltransferase family 2 protein [Candidimonas sp.]|nr:glycosyltransferase family 2 protein [Candidimonas sp.]
MTPESNDAVALAIVVPCYNEELMLPIATPRLLALLSTLSTDRLCRTDSFLVLVDDGSSDDTWTLIEEAVKRNPTTVRGIRLSRNVGHQSALFAGLEYCIGKCDAAVSIDADLQDDISVIRSMVEKYRDGAELVLGVRKSRTRDTWFKRNTARAFYRLMRQMGVALVADHADFRLMSQKSLMNLALYRESNLFLRGLVPILHRRIETVEYHRAERVAGETKYPLKKMISLAWNGITSFSVVPLRLISLGGAVVFLTSLLMIAYAIYGLAADNTLPGWASIVIPLYLLGGLIMLSIGVAGEYIGKLFIEVKRRPRYLIDSITGEQNERQNEDKL